MEVVKAILDIESETCWEPVCKKKHSDESEIRTKLKWDKNLDKETLDFRDIDCHTNLTYSDTGCSTFTEMLRPFTYPGFTCPGVYCLNSQTIPSCRWLQSIQTGIFIILFLQVLIPVCNSCYVFPPGKKNPCADKECEFGATCVSTADGMEARCQCPQQCYDYGDSYGSTPLCGNDGNDYDNYCELRRESCKTMNKIKVKYYGKCGEYIND